MNNLLTLTPAEFCAATHACKEGRDWAITQPTMADVWDNCPRGDWLVWVANRVQAADARTLRLFAVWCARSTPIADGRVTGDLLTDPRSIAALKTAERYAYKQATAEELAAAARLADAAYADANYNFAAYATYAACAAHAAYATDTYDYYAAAVDAASASAYAYADADATAAAAYAPASLHAIDDDWLAAQQAQANQFRLMVPNPFPRTEAQS